MSTPLFQEHSHQHHGREPDWQTLNARAHIMAHELLPRLERPQEGLALYQRKLAAYRTTLQNFFYNRSLDREGREDFRPLYFIWTVVRACNFLCTYCDDHQGHRYPELSNKGVLNTEQGKRLLSVMRTRTPSVYFAGGEPTARQDLPVLTRHARDLNYYPIIVNTNGSLIAKNLAKATWRSWLADVDIVIVSLDGLDLNILGPMWGFQNPEVVFENLLLLQKLSKVMGFKLMVNTVIQPGIVAQARAVLDWAREQGIWFCGVPMNLGPTVHPKLKEDPEYIDLVEIILAHKRAGQRISGSLRMNERLFRSDPLNCRNTLKPHVDFDGRLFWPCKASVNIAPRTLNVLDYTDLAALYADATAQVSPHHFHGPAANQCGANCNWAQNYSTDAYVHGLRHPWSLLSDVRSFLGAA